MNDISDARVDELLREAEQRLQKGSVSSVVAAAPKAAGLISQVDNSATPTQSQPQDAVATTKEKLSVRTPQTKADAQRQKAKDTAGSDWFDLPKTNLTPEFKRDWQLLRMRSLLDPKHQKKALRASAPQYSQVGEIIEGPTEFYSARLTRKERKRTLLEEVASEHDAVKLQNKYAGIQKKKTSGKKAFYKNVVAQRRKSRN